jgi:hypothetical protein
VLAEGQHGAPRVTIHGAGVGRRLAVAVEQDAGFQLLAFIAGDAHFSHRNDARRHVEDDRPFGLWTRYGDTNGVGAEARVGTAPGRHGRPCIGDVDEMERDEARLGADFTIGADPADMVRVAQGDDRDAGVARLGDPDHCRFARGNLAPGARAVVDDQRPVLADDAPLAIGEDGAVGEMVQIVRDQTDAVAVMAAQIGLDQVVGDDARLVRVTAGRGEDAGCNAVQLCVVYQHHPLILSLIALGH